MDDLINEYFSMFLVTSWFTVKNSHLKSVETPVIWTLTVTGGWKSKWKIHETLQLALENVGRRCKEYVRHMWVSVLYRQFLSQDSQHIIIQNHKHFRLPDIQIGPYLRPCSGLTVKYVFVKGKAVCVINNCFLLPASSAVFAVWALGNKSHLYIHEERNEADQIVSIPLLPVCHLQHAKTHNHTLQNPCFLFPFSTRVCVCVCVCLLEIEVPSQQVASWESGADQRGGM